MSNRKIRVLVGKPGDDYRGDRSVIQREAGNENEGDNSGGHSQPPGYKVHDGVGVDGEPDKQDDCSPYNGCRSGHPPGKL